MEQRQSKMEQIVRKIAPLIVILAAAAATPGRGGEQTVEAKVEQPIQQAVSLRKQTRREETAWQDRRDRLLAQVERMQKEQAARSARRTRLQAEKSATQARITEKTTRLARIDQISE